MMSKNYESIWADYKTNTRILLDTIFAHLKKITVSMESLVLKTVSLICQTKC